MMTIWGKADDITEHAPGITEVSTPSHGGFILSPERLAMMPDKFRKCSYTKDNNFEEDCSWCAVVLAWPNVFEPERIVAAQNMYDQFYANKE